MSDGIYPAETCHRLNNTRTAERSGIIRCDTFGCNETHPIDHEALGEPSFGTGRWLGWVYLDLNRPDLFERQLRFCSVNCCRWWLEREIVTRGTEQISPLDKALRSPHDEVARKAALKSIGTQP